MKFHLMTSSCIQPWYKFFANVTDKVLFATFPKNHNFSVLINM